MRFNPFGLFLNPRTRPRAIVWSGVLLIGFTIMWAAGLILTSTEWFCTTPCHIVHDDNTAAYHQSTHGKVSCIACHEPLAASPYTFTMMKIHVLPDLPATILHKFEMPVNDGSYVALEMPSEQCTQCHNLDNRDATPTQGILIDHKVHEEQGVACTTCHNRVAHPEDDVTLVLEGNRKHDDWAKMDGCFRCHSLEKDAEAPGTCSSCHTKKFDLEPSSHKENGWYAKFGESSGHARAAIEESSSVSEALKAAGERAKEHGEEAEGEQLKPSSAVNSCYTCHKSSFCDSCHGTQMPHPTSFTQSHSKPGYADPSLCAQCHARSREEAKGLGSCDACHHPTGKPGVPWVDRHPGIVRDKGADECFKCHEEVYCSRCHVKVSSTLR